VLGDRAYVNRQFTDALVEYRLALRRATGADPSLHARTAAAALRAGELVEAAREYRILARAGGASRATEAADGLERVARAAADADDRAALDSALSGLREVAAGRVLGSLALELAASVSVEARPGESARVLPYAAAGAPDASRLDSLLYVYGVALSRSGRCAEASGVFEGVVRRQRHSVAAGSALRELTRCAVQLGRRAMEQSQLEEAEKWFRAAAAGAGPDAINRAAYIGLGDVLSARSDFVGAAEAYQRALTGAAPDDSLAQVAAQRLDALGSAATGVR
jgi:tetratricopeptide (TPR) repeat protein